MKERGEKIPIELEFSEILELFLFLREKEATLGLSLLSTLSKIEGVIYDRFSIDEIEREIEAYGKRPPPLGQ